MYQKTSNKRGCESIATTQFRAETCRSTVIANWNIMVLSDFQAPAPEWELAQVLPIDEKSSLEPNSKYQQDALL